MTTKGGIHMLQPALMGVWHAWNSRPSAGLYLGRVTPKCNTRCLLKIPPPQQFLLINCCIHFPTNSPPPNKRAPPSPPQIPPNAPPLKTIYSPHKKNFLLLSQSARFTPPPPAIPAVGGGSPGPMGETPPKFQANFVLGGRVHAGTG